MVIYLTFWVIYQPIGIQLWSVTDWLNFLNFWLIIFLFHNSNYFIFRVISRNEWDFQFFSNFRKNAFMVFRDDSQRFKWAKFRICHSEYSIVINCLQTVAHAILRTLNNSLPFGYWSFVLNITTVSWSGGVAGCWILANYLTARGKCMEMAVPPRNHWII